MTVAVCANLAFKTVRDDDDINFTATVEMRELGNKKIKFRGIIVEGARDFCLQAFQQKRTIDDSLENNLEKEFSACDEALYSRISADYFPFQIKNNQVKNLESVSNFEYFFETLKSISNKNNGENEV
uniref:Uncharacterized protein n=1 Tax=Romanomermis culicivorax TaxID=13658 RepID=A0A915KW88_ROMCU